MFYSCGFSSSPTSTVSCVSVQFYVRPVYYSRYKLYRRGDALYAPTLRHRIYSTCACRCVFIHRWHVKQVRQFSFQIPGATFLFSSCYHRVFPPLEPNRDVRVSPIGQIFVPRPSFFFRSDPRTLPSSRNLPFARSISPAHSLSPLSLFLFHSLSIILPHRFIFKLDFLDFSSLFFLFFY